MSLTQRTDCRCFLLVFVVLIWIELVPWFQCFDHARTVSAGLVAGNSKNLGHTMNMIDDNNDDDDGGDENIYYGSLNGQSDNAALQQDPNWKDYRHGIPGHGSIKSIHGELTNPINHNDNDTKDDDDDDDDDYEYDYSTGISAGKNLHINNNNNDDDTERKHGKLREGQQHQRKITKFHYGTSIINNNNNTQSKLVMAKARLKDIPNGINIIMATSSSQHRNDDRIIMNQNQKISKKPKKKEQQKKMMMMKKEEEEEKDSNNSMKAKKQQRWQNNNHNNGKNMENVLGRFNLFHSKTNPLSWFWPSSSSSAAKQQWKHTTTTINNKNNNENELSSFCLEVKCRPDEYCFKPEAGVAECLKKENDKKFLVHENVHGRHRNNNMINRPTKNNIKNKWSNKNKNSANLMDLEDNDDDDDDVDDVLFQDDDQDDLVDHDQHYKRKKSGKNLRSDKEIDGKFNRKSAENKKKKNNQNVNDSQSRTSLANQQRRMPAKISNNQELRMNGDCNQIKNANNLKSFNNKTKIIQCPSCPFTYGQIVCGTNNASYSSMCRIEFHNCVHQTNIKFACFGFCPCTKISNNNNNNNQHQHQHQHPEPKPSRRPCGDWDSVDHPEILLLNQNHTKHSMAGKSRESLKRYHYDFGQHNNVSNGRPSPKNCSPEELHSMGVRLLDWFLVVMKEEIKHRNKSTSQKLTSSGIQQTELPDCEEQVSFMFYHFDLDHNFKLTTKELYYLKHDENEHCLEPYLLQCDEDRDDLLSAHEWCSCFDFRSKPCLYQRRQMAKKNPNGLKPAQYVPQCDQNGHYRNVQCNPSNNYCWCSDKNGNEIAGTGVHGRLAICDKVYPLSLNRFSNKNNKRIQPPPTSQQQQQKKRQQVLVLNLDQDLKVRTKVSNQVKKPMPLANRDHKLRRVSDGQDHHHHHHDEDDDDDDDDESGDDDDDEGSFSMDRGSGLDSF